MGHAHWAKKNKSTIPLAAGNTYFPSGQLTNSRLLSLRDCGITIEVGYIPNFGRNLGCDTQSIQWLGAPYAISLRGFCAKCRIRPIH
jgi:hypothetical protein